MVDKKSEYQVHVEARLFAGIGILIVAWLLYYTHRLYSMKRWGGVVLFGIPALLGLFRTFVDFGFFHCNPSFINRVQGKQCSPKKSKIPTKSTKTRA